MYDNDFMEIGQLESGSIDAYWVSESTTLTNRYITPETALTTDFAAASGKFRFHSLFIHDHDTRRGNLLSRNPWKQIKKMEYL